MDQDSTASRKRLSISNLKKTFISRIARNYLMKKTTATPNTKSERVLKKSTLYYKARSKEDKDQTGVYVGEWKHGDMHGYGRIIKQNFSVYEGFFKRGQRQGVGVELLPTQELFVGEFKNDLKSGLGLYFFKQGGFYVGFFKEGKRDGFGILVDHSGKELYRGFWKEELKDGRGVESFEGGAKFDGFYKSGRREGVGLMEYSKTLTYIGEWKDHKRHGSGVVQTPEKDIEGVFFENELMQIKGVNPSEFFDSLMKHRLPENIEKFLKLKKYKIKRKKRKSSQDLETMLGNGLSQLAFQLVLHKERKLGIYLILKFLFGRRSKLDSQISKMFFCLNHKLDICSPFELWDPKFFELVNLKRNYPWSFYIVTRENKEGQAEMDLGLTRSQNGVNLQMTNEVTRGEGFDQVAIEGANHPNGVNVSFYCSKRGKLDVEKELFICPVYVISSDVEKAKINRSISLSEKLFANAYKSRFFVYCFFL